MGQHLGVQKKDAMEDACALAKRYRLGRGVERSSPVDEVNVKLKDVGVWAGMSAVLQRKAPSGRAI